jgi:acyl carrier protein phosphodiesterase
LHAKYGHYAGVIMDIIYDHFLAKNWEKYSNESLERYVNDFYQLLDDHLGILTEKTKNLLPYMKQNNWLLSYQSIEGIEKILFQMDYRTKHRAKMQEAIVELELFYPEIEEEFTLFFSELQFYVAQQLTHL